MRSVFFVTAFLALIGVSPFSAKAEEASSVEDIVKVEILVRVANRSVSTRDLEVFAVMVEPKIYSTRAPHVDLSETQRQALLQEIIVQILVEEENKILGSAGATEEEVDSAVERMRGALRSNVWASFLRTYELSQADLRERAKRMVVVERALELRLQDALGSLGTTDRRSEDQKMADAEKSLQNWIQRLRSRYKVQNMVRAR